MHFNRWRNAFSTTRNQGFMAHLIYLNSYEMNLSDLSHSQICQSPICDLWGCVGGRESPICEAVRVRERPCGSPIGLSRTPGDAVILGAVWLISRLNALLRPVESDRRLVCVRGQSDSHTASHRLSDRSHDLRVRSASHAQRAMLSSSGPSDWFHGQTHCIARCAWEVDRTPTDRTLKSVRPIGLSRTAGDAVWSSGPSDWFHG